MFVKQYLQEYTPSSSGNKEVSLEGPSGKTWPVSILGWKYSSMGFKTGWRRFATDHGLVVGDIVIFRMICKGYFVVQIFERWGLEKGGLITHDEDKCHHGKRKHREQDGPFYVDTEEVAKLKQGQKVARIFEEEDMVFRPTIHDAEIDELLILDYEQRGPTRELSPGNKNSVVIVSQSSQRSICCSLQQTANDAQVKLPNIQKCQNLKTNPLHKIKRSVMKSTVGVRQSVNSNTERSVDDKERIRYTFVSQRRPVSQTERDAALKAAKALKTKGPAVRKIMTVSNVYRGFWLGIPTKFAVKYLPAQTEPITLLDSSGNTWRAKWLGNRRNGGLSGGWRRFTFDHNLEEGDVCTFELVDNKKLVLKVHICRVVELSDCTFKPLQKSWEEPKDLTTLVKQLQQPQNCSPFLGKMRGAINSETDYRNRKRSTLDEFRQQKKFEQSENLEKYPSGSLSKVALDCCSKRGKMGSPCGSHVEELIGMENENGRKLVPSTGTVEGKGKSQNRAFLRYVGVKQELESKGVQETEKKEVEIQLIAPSDNEQVLVSSVVKKEITTSDFVDVEGVPLTCSQNLFSTCSMYKSLQCNQQICIKEEAVGLENRTIVPLPSQNPEYCNTVSMDGNFMKKESGEGAINESCVNESATVESNSPVPNILENQDDVSKALNRAEQRQAKKGKSKLVKKCSRRAVGKEIEREYYEVERLISRRRGRKEDEFLVQLGDPTTKTKDNDNHTIACDEEDGAWWVPLSHFKCGFKSCHL